MVGGRALRSRGRNVRGGGSINSRQPAARASAQACSPVGGGGADTLRSARACGDTLRRCKSRCGERDLDAGIHQSVVDRQRKRATDGKPVSVVARPDSQMKSSELLPKAVNIASGWYCPCRQSGGAHHVARQHLQAFKRDVTWACLPCGIACGELQTGG